MLPLNEKFWIKPDDEPNVFGLGLSEEFLARLGQVWSIIPRSHVKAGAKLVKDQIFANIETSRCLFPLRAPCDGTFVGWNETALDCPDSVKSDTAILNIGDVK